MDAARWLAARGISRDTALTARLGVVDDPMPGHARYAGMLAIPYLDRAGEPLQLRFRCIQDHDHRAHHHGKYNSVAGDPVRLYGIDSLHEAGDEIHVTEGEFDRLVLRQLGLHAVCVPGANLFQPRHRRMLAGFSRIWTWGDPDDAGAELNAKIARGLRQAKAVNLRDGDVTDTFLKGGAPALLSLIGLEDTPPWS
ncbi:toprim domain-containing protein [Catenuloplanes sp. NPDC051500]|uniref:toprim domain-containing protein n=1 Tax=Catenuloplanes sp. NPDC051500 TaxID=3363959 RepID=UPI0037A72CE9